MSLKLRLNLMISLLLLLILAMASYVFLNDAKSDVRLETQSTMKLAAYVLEEKAQALIKQHTFSNEDLFKLYLLNHLRHLRIEFFDSKGQLKESNQQAKSKAATTPPGWFINLFSDTTDVKPVRQPVLSDGSYIGELVITPNPYSEIMEVWDSAIGIFWVALIFYCSVILLVSLMIDKALSPLSQVTAGFSAVAQGNMGTRLPEFRLPELSAISNGFNHMIQSLAASKEQSESLTKQIIHLQDEERKKLARDLHDELGQTLTAISAEALTIMDYGKKEGLPVEEGASAIYSMTKQVMNLLSSLLQRLRPEGLDESNLSFVLTNLMASWQQRNRHVLLTYAIDESMGDLPDIINVTIYRVAQESLTNISRHAKAKKADVRIHRKNGKVIIHITDDGVGFNPSKKNRLGLTGMRERVETLGGVFDLSSMPDSGTQISVELTVQDGSP